MGNIYEYILRDTLIWISLFRVGSTPPSSRPALPKRENVFRIFGTLTMLLAPPFGIGEQERRPQSCVVQTGTEFLSLRITMLLFHWPLGIS